MEVENRAIGGQVDIGLDLEGAWLEGEGGFEEREVRVLAGIVRQAARELIDALLEKHGISPEAVLGENGLIAQLKKRVVERAFAGELTHSSWLRQRRSA